ncbi:MAG TPA: cupin [Intrasporangiaceae bacterium]|nr:cupin [Intrasporangiaceae bacterium]
MVRLIPTPAVIDVPGGKVIREHVGRVATGHENVSVAHMVAPARWSEPAQQPEFDEVTMVLRGVVLVEHEGGIAQVEAGQSIITPAGKRVRYSVGPDGAEYVAICLPAFSPETVNRDEEEPA